MAGARRFRHQSFHQQQCPIFGKGLAAIPQNDATALVVPIVDHAFQDDGVRPGWNRLKEIAGEEAGTVGDSQAIKMMVGDLGASGKIENGSPNIWVLLCHSTDQFAGAASYIHQMRNAAKIVGTQDIGGYQPRHICHRRIEYTDILRHAGHQVEAVSDILDFRGGFAAGDRLEHAIPRFGEHLAFEYRPMLEGMLSIAIQPCA